MTLTRETKEMYLRPRGHALLRQKYERIEDIDGEYMGYTEWTKLTALTSLSGDSDSGEVWVDFLFDTMTSCSWCDEYCRYEVVDENTIQTTTECPYADGIQTTVEVDVPSGRLLVDDDLRPVIDYEIDQDAGYNSRLGQAQVVEGYAREANAFYGPTLNTSPSLYEIEPGRYVIANGEWDDDTDEWVPLSLGGKAIAGVCTDLWAFTMVDYEQWLAKGGKPIEEDDKYGTRSVVEIPAGRYRMVYHGGEKDFDFDAMGEVIFAHIERIGDCS